MRIRLLRRFITVPVFLWTTLSVGAQAVSDSRPELIVCEDANVRLGQSKQDVRDALSVCCRRVMNLPAFIKNDDNQINFESKDGSRKCEGILDFDGQERLVYAFRQFQHNPFDATTLADSLFQAIDRVLQGQPVRSDNGWTLRYVTAGIVLAKLSGPRGSTDELQLLLGGHILKLERTTSQTRADYPIDYALLSDEIGDPSRHVVLTLPSSPAK